MIVLRAPELLALAVIPLALAVAIVGRAAARPMLRRHAAELGLRCLALLMLVIAVAQPTWQRGAAGSALAVLVDVSDSITPSARAVEASWLQRATARASSTAPVTVIAFAGTAAVTTLYRPVDHTTALALLHARADGARTDLAGALRLATGVVPPGSRLLLLSDGVQTVGDATADVPDLTARHLSLDTVLLDRPGPDVAVTRLVLPPAAPTGAALPLQVTLHSTRAVTATLTLRIDGRTAGRQTLALQAGDNPYQIDLPGQAAGWHVVRASISAPDDAEPRNDILSAATDVTPAPRVLLVTQRPSNAAALTRLTAAALDVVALPPSRMPTSVAGLSPYGEVVLDDLPATALDGARVAALDGAVRRRGIGLVVLGGPHSLTQGHYSQTALERLLPVLSDTPASLQDGNVALQLVLDRSGSMDDLAGDVPKIVMSRAAARLAADFAVQHKDNLGILDFDQVSHILIPMGKVGPADSSHIDREINGMFSDGGTNIYQALQTGIAQVSQSAAPYHHIILMTDGMSDPANYQPLLKLAQQHKITISTVALGPDADVGLLRSIASAGKGRFYYTTNAQDLPRIFAEEARLAAGSAAVTGDVGVRIAANSPTVRSLGAGPLPRLAGYIATVLKPGAVDDLETNTHTRKPDPVLARWQDGLGRVLVWTPGLDNAWSASWQRAEPAFWSDALHWTLRGPAVAADTPTLDGVPTPDGIRIDTLANGGTPIELQRLAIDVRTPGGAVTHPLVAQTSPGLYRAPYQFTTTGVYTATVRPLTGDGSPTQALLAVPYSREYLPMASNASLLSALSGATTGTVLREPDQLAPPPRSGAALSLWWALALTALAVYMAGIVAGRVAVSAGEHPI